jgi:hypothetical protein
VPEFFFEKSQPTHATFPFGWGIPKRNLISKKCCRRFGWSTKVIFNLGRDYHLRSQDYLALMLPIAIPKQIPGITAPYSRSSPHSLRSLHERLACKVGKELDSVEDVGFPMPLAPAMRLSQQDLYPCSK